MAVHTTGIQPTSKEQVLSGIRNDVHLTNRDAFQVDPSLTSSIKSLNTSTVAPPPLNPQPQMGPPEPPTQSAAQIAATKRKEIEGETNARLSENSDYQELNAMLEAWKNLEAEFNAIDAHTGVVTNDRTITLENLQALVNDPFFPNEEAKAAAKHLLDNISVWNELAKGDDQVGKHDVQAFIAGMKDKKKAIESQTREEVRTELYPPSSSSAATGTGGSGAPQAGGAGSSNAPGGGETAPGTPDKVDTSFHPPKPSDKAGMEGATENLAGTADALQDQMMRLAEEASKDPSKATINGQKIAMLQNQFQAITNMMNQLTQMMSNLSKMWSDVAMNSIRNLK